jgi:hypothetical protein
LISDTVAKRGLLARIIATIAKAGLDGEHYPHGVDQLHGLADKAQALMQRVIGFKPKTP